MIAVLGAGAGGLVLGLGDLGETAVGVDCAMVSGDDVAHALAAAEEDHGPLGAVVLASTGPAATERGDLAGLDGAQWRQRLEVPLGRTLACFQGAHARLRTGGGCLVVLVPTLALVGAAGFAPWAALAEAQRSLAKAAARSWGGGGGGGVAVRVNCVAVPAALLAAPSGAGPGWDRPGQPNPALGREPDLRTGVAPVVASFVSDRLSGVTGATVAVDGGIWMTP